MNDLWFPAFLLALAALVFLFDRFDRRPKPYER